MAESEKPKYDAETASNSVHLVAENLVTRIGSRPASAGSETVQPDLHFSTLHQGLLTLCQWVPEPD